MEESAYWSESGGQDTNAYDTYENYQSYSNSTYY